MGGDTVVGFILGVFVALLFLGFMSLGFAAKEAAVAGDCRYFGAFIIDDKKYYCSSTKGELLGGGE